jgi:hypothetical protein
MYSFGKTTGRAETFKDILPTVPDLLNMLRAIDPKASLKEVGNYLTTAMFMPDPGQIQTMFKFWARNPISHALLKSWGIDKTGLPDLPKILESVRKHSKNANDEMMFMGKIFGRNAVPLKYLLDSYKDYNKAIQESQTDKLAGDIKIASESMESGATKISTAIKKMTDLTLEPIMKNFASQINLVDVSKIEGMSKAFQVLGNALVFAVKGITDWLSFFGKTAGGLEIIGKEAAEDWKEHGWKSLIPEYLRPRDANDLRGESTLGGGTQFDILNPSAPSNVLRKKWAPYESMAEKRGAEFGGHPIGEIHLHNNITLDKEGNVKSQSIMAADSRGNQIKDYVTRDR